MKKVFIGEAPYTEFRYTKASRWIRIRYDYVTKRHSLYDFADKEKEGGILTCFKFKGRTYALGQFMRLTYPVFIGDEYGKLSVISGYDALAGYNPLLIEIHPDGECVRLWSEEWIGKR